MLFSLVICHPQLKTGSLKQRGCDISNSVQFRGPSLDYCWPIAERSDAAPRPCRGDVHDCKGLRRDRMSESCPIDHHCMSILQVGTADVRHCKNILQSSSENVVRMLRPICFQPHLEQIKREK